MDAHSAASTQTDTLSQISEDGRYLTLEAIERHMITTRLEALGGNKTAAAKSLGISLKTLYNKLNRYREEDAKRGARS